MNDRTFESLELGAFMELAARHVQTPQGRLRLLALRPSVSQSDILQELAITSECVSFLNTNGRFNLAGIEDPCRILANLLIQGISLEPQQILALERILSLSQQLRDLVKSTEAGGPYPNLLRIAAGIPDLKHLLTNIRGKVLPSGELDDNASPELRAVRKELTNCRSRIYRSLETILQGQPHAVQDEIITFRNGRFVIPVRADSRAQVPGVVHGLSSSGQTVFVEPLTVISQNNELVRLREQEEIEISRILLSITDYFRENLDAIRAVAEILTQWDVVQAKASFSIEFQCVRPRISDAKRYALRDARHVLLEHTLRRSGEKPVPISLELDENHQVLIVSGPNAGGKTVVLKTLGLISLMAQMGFHVPAREALLPVFSQVFADIGDQQSISANLSTFTAHMRNIAEMAQQTRPPALILLDEVGTGTDPDEGAALAVSIVDYFRRSGATTVASTHYPQLKMWASQTEGVRNSSVEFDEATLRPTYRLIMGVSGASSGIEIARRMHIAEDILDMARVLIEPSHAQAREYLRQLKETLDAQECLRAALDEERAAVAAKHSKLERDFAAREEARRIEFDTALTRLLNDFKAESERSLLKIKNRIEAARIQKHVDNEAAKLRRKLISRRQDPGLPQGGTDESRTDPAGAADRNEEIRPGDRVRIRSLDRTGTVESSREGVYVVIVGSLRYRADRADLIRAGGTEKTAGQPSGSPDTVDTPDHEAAVELKVIGMTADEALNRVDKFLDQAFLAGVDSVRIIHGYGKGVLRRAIAGLLANHPQVEQFRPAPADQGGGGTTIVELKK